MAVTVDLTGVRTLAEFHERVRAALTVPAWYGDNLDALHDLLTEGDEPVTFRHAGDLRAAQPRFAAALERLCRETAHTALTWD